MSFPQYPEYKDSGVEWLGEVPAHWEVAPLKYLTNFVNGMAFKPDEWSPEGVPIIRIENLNDSENFNFYGGEVDKRYHVRKGDLLFGWSGNKGTSFGPYVWPRSGLHYLNQHIFRLSEVEANKKWLYWALKAVTKTIEDQAHGIIGMVHVTKGKLGGIPVPEICLKEQAAIAAFLDHETARIDALVEEQQRLVALLKEKRQAVISHAVTKGLDPDVPVKDSGVEWLGEVPAHWVRKRLKNVSPFITVGIVVNPSSYLAEEGIPFIYGGEVREGYINVEKARKISPEDSFRNRKTMLEADDLVTMRVGYPGVTAVVPPECEGGNCASVMLVKKGSYDSRWLCAAMNSRLIRHQVEMVQYGAAQKQFNISDAIEFWIFEPPLDEQKNIASYIDKESSAFDQLIGEAKRNMELLSERRSALISAAVTGKIDVRGWTPPADEAPADQDARMEAV